MLCCRKLSNIIDYNCKYFLVQSLAAAASALATLQGSRQLSANHANHQGQGLIVTLNPGKHAPHLGSGVFGEKVPSTLIHEELQPTVYIPTPSKIARQLREILSEPNFLKPILKLILAVKAMSNVRHNMNQNASLLRMSF